MWLKHRLMQANPDGGAGGDGGAANTPWFPETHKSIVESKGWKGPADAIDSYANLEKLIGADKAGRTVVLPKDDKDEEGIKAFRSKMGVPEAADKYELPLPEGDDGTFAKVAASWFHQHGIPKSAAQGISKAWNEHIAGLVKADEERAQNESQMQLTKLKTEWGGEFDKRSEFARRFLRASGWDDAKVTQYEQTFGTAAMLKDFYGWGSKMAEPDFAGDGNKGGGGADKQAAQNKLNEMRIARSEGKVTDTEWFNGKQAEYENLARIVHT